MEQQSVSKHPDPSKIMQVGMGFWASKALLTAVNFRLFTILATTSKKALDIKNELHLNTTDRHIYDWLDVLVSLGFLKREGILENAVYSNSEDTGMFLDENKPSYIGGILKMGNNRLYKFWGSLEEGLMTGKPQNESKYDGNMHFFEELYQSPERLSEFVNAMSGIQGGNFMTLAKKFDFSKYKNMADIGGADGFLSCMIALQHPAIVLTTYDLLPVGPLAERAIAKFNLTNRIKVESGDFLKDTIPSAEIISMGNILHGLNETTKLTLIKKVYDALPENGVLIAIENIIDNARTQNTFGMLMSLNMLIENGDAFDYTFDDFEKWVKEAGFVKTELIPLTGPASAAIAYKS
ncbi:MAG TPA: methyltransferase [Ginsengibacter sp.]